MFYPPLKRNGAKQIVTGTFAGLNRAEKIGDGQWAKAMNLSTREYPMLCPRKPRGTVRTLVAPAGMIAKDKLCWVDGEKIYYDGQAVDGLTISTAAADQPKRLVGMGAYVVIFPDKKYFNTVDLAECGSLEDEMTATAPITYALCRADGSDYPTATATSIEPENPENGDYWIDLGSEPHRLMLYSETLGAWQQIYTVYTRITIPGIGAHFKEGDTVEISGIAGSAYTPTQRKASKEAAHVYIADAGADAVSAFTVKRIPLQTGSGTPSEYNVRPFRSWKSCSAYLSPTVDAADGVTLSADWESTAGALYGFEIDYTAGTLINRYGHIAELAEGAVVPEPWISSMDEYLEGKQPSVGAEVIYQLAEPVVYQITPRSASTTMGINHAWADTGDVSFNYLFYDFAYTKALTQLEEMNGSQHIYANGDDWIVILGLLDEVMTQSSGQVKITRKCPDMEFVIENDNRLWGCHYGRGEDGSMLNEIYACKLGDFKNWRVYQGISTDSYAVSLGSDGPFTGAIAYGGMPMFFKETCVHKLYGSQPKNYQVMSTQLRGVQQGSEKSLCIVDGTLLYMSTTGVEAYDGSLPGAVGTELGDAERSAGVAGTLGSRYYLKCEEGGEPKIYVYDLRLNIWMEEDGARALDFVSYESDLYMLDGDTGEIITMAGTAGDLEEQVEWLAETGLQGWEQVNQKYVTRFNIRAVLPAKSRLKCSLQYDSAGRWHEKMDLVNYAVGTRTLLMPVYPKRCDHIRMRLEGAGEIKIYSISRLMANGGDGQRG